MKNKTTKWTPNEDGILLRMAVEGASIKAISKRLRRSEAAVTNRARSMKKSLAGLLKEKQQRGPTRHRQGHRKHLGVSVRSSWEANFLTVLNHKKIKWSYEPEMFIFHEIQRGTRAYLPDVYLPKEDIWIEVKGMIRPQDKTKIRRFKKYYPEEFAKLQCVVRNPRVAAAKFFESMGVPVYAYYDDLEKKYQSLKNWES